MLHVPQRVNSDNESEESYQTGEKDAEWVNVNACGYNLRNPSNPTPLEFSEAKRNLELAQVDFDNANSIFNRKQELFNSKLISQEQYDIARAEFSESKLRLQLANEKFDLLQKGVTVDGKNENTIISPIDGTILEKLVNEGDPVVPLTSYQAGTPLLSLAPMEKLVFKGTVDEIDVGATRVTPSALSSLPKSSPTHSASTAAW